MQSESLVVSKVSGFEVWFSGGLGELIWWWGGVIWGFLHVLYELDSSVLLMCAFILLLL